MNKDWQEKQKESIQSGYNRAKELAKNFIKYDIEYIKRGQIRKVECFDYER